MKKTRSDSVIDGLPENQRQQIEAWLFEENLSYKDCAERCWQDLSVRVSSSALAEFRQRRCRARVLESIADSSSTSKTVTEELRKNADKSYEAVLGLIGQTVLEMKIRGENLDLESLKDIAGIVALGLKSKTDAKKVAQKDTELAQAAKKLELELEKYRDEVAEKKKTILDATATARKEGGLSAATLEQIEAAAKIL